MLPRRGKACTNTYHTQPCPPRSCCWRGDNNSSAIECTCVATRMPAKVERQSWGHRWRVCVCACVRESAASRERDPHPPRCPALGVCVCMCVCVWCVVWGRAGWLRGRESSRMAWRMVGLVSTFLETFSARTTPPPPFSSDDTMQGMSARAPRYPPQTDRPPSPSSTHAVSRLLSSPLYTDKTRQGIDSKKCTEVRFVLEGVCASQEAPPRSLASLARVVSRARAGCFSL